MRADDEQVWFLPSSEFGDALVVGVNLSAVEGENFFLCAQDEGHLGLTVDGAGVIEGVAAVQYPAVAGVDGDGGVAAGVSGHG